MSINEIERIPFVNLTEITIGRDPSSNIAFNPRVTILFPRRHAVIRVIRGDQISSVSPILVAATGPFSIASQSPRRRSFFPRTRSDWARTG